jgi:hypothetical protein
MEREWHRKGGLARIAKLTPEQRVELARKATNARWERERLHPEGKTAQLQKAIAVISRGLRARGVHPILQEQWKQWAKMVLDSPTNQPQDELPLGLTGQFPKTGVDMPTHADYI